MYRFLINIYLCRCSIHCKFGVPLACFLCNPFPSREHAAFQNIKLGSEQRVQVERWWWHKSQCTACVLGLLLGWADWGISWGRPKPVPWPFFIFWVVALGFGKTGWPWGVWGKAGPPTRLDNGWAPFIGISVIKGFLQLNAWGTTGQRAAHVVHVHDYFFS